MIYHVKINEVSSFKPITRKQPFVCRTADSARGSYIIVTEGDGETVDQTRRRLKRLETTAELCGLCAVKLAARDADKEQK